MKKLIAICVTILDIFYLGVVHSPFNNNKTSFVIIEETLINKPI